MKWIPISKLGDHQTGGNWVLFCSRTSTGLSVEQWRLRKGWHEEREENAFGWFDGANNFIEVGDMRSCFSHFLDVPLPEIIEEEPKNGWIRSVDRDPEAGEMVLLWVETTRYKEICRGMLCRVEEDVFEWQLLDEPKDADWSDDFRVPFWKYLPGGPY